MEALIKVFYFLNFFIRNSVQISMKFTALSLSIFLFIISCQNKNSQVVKIEKLCLIESEKRAGMSQGIVEYCACAAPKILAKVKDNKTIMAKFDQNEFHHINELKDSAFTAILDNCVPGDKLIYNPPTMEFLLPERAENSIRVTLIDQMDAEFQANHNVEQYCDCYIHSIKTKLSFEEFNAKDIESLPKYKAILKDCETKSLK